MLFSPTITGYLQECEQNSPDFAGSQVYKRFTILKSLGYGCSSKVFLVQDTDGEKYAIKAIRKDKNYSHNVVQRMLKHEHQVLEKVKQHPNFIRSYVSNQIGELTAGSSIESIVYNIIEYAPNGTLADFIRYTGPIEEDIARLFMAQICHAIEYLHNIGYAHLDIKLENILLDEYFNIKIADLGSSTDVTHTGGFTSLKRGTKYYLPPEVETIGSQDFYDAKSADLYTLGITLFAMLTGEFPTKEEIQNNLCTIETQSEFEISSTSRPKSDIKVKWDELSDDVKDLIQSLTEVDPIHRPEIKNVMNDPWFSTHFTEELVQDVYEEMLSRKEYMALNFKKTFL